MDNWNFYTDINFEDETINQFHVDTRDFHCVTNSEKNSETDFDKLLKKQPENFIHTPQQVTDLLTRLFNESGGKKSWRCLYLDSNNKIVNDWLKYIRIHRTEKGLIVCDRNNYALNKEILSCKVKQELL